MRFRARIFTQSWPSEAKKARLEAWQAELGAINPQEVDRRIRRALDGAKAWVLCGGPPCQAYSIVGRSRNRGIRPRDHRLYLYREYLRILAVHAPPLFVMENVKGLLSSQIHGVGIFRKMVNDLSNPAVVEGVGQPNRTARYHIFPFVSPQTVQDRDGFPNFEPRDFVIKCEDYGVPQTRHRVILLGVRADLSDNPVPSLGPIRRMVSCAQALKGLPRIRSGISRTADSPEEWKSALAQISGSGILYGLVPELERAMRSELN